MAGKRTHKKVARELHETIEEHARTPVETPLGRLNGAFSSGRTSELQRRAEKAVAESNKPEYRQSRLY